MKNKILSIAVLTGVFSAIAGGLSIAATSIKEVSSQLTSSSTLQAQSDEFRNSQINMAKQIEAKQIVTLMARAQMSWRLQNKEFSTSFDRLEIGVPQESQNYRYSIRSSNNSKFVQNLATAKTSGLKNYLSLVVLHRDKKGYDFPHATICISNQANQKISQNVSFPKMRDGDPVCPKGYEKVTR